MPSIQTLSHALPPMQPPGWPELWNGSPTGPRGTDTVGGGMYVCVCGEADEKEEEKDSRR